MKNQENKNSFDWGLMPLNFITKITVATPLGFTKKTKSFKAVVFFVFFGWFIFLSNILINGPRGIDKANFDWMKNIKNFDSPFTYFKHNPDALLQFVVQVTSLCFFVSLPLIQIIFLATSFFGNDSNRLISILRLIKKELKLCTEFFQRCQRHSITAILTMILV